MADHFYSTEVRILAIAGPIYRHQASDLACSFPLYPDSRSTWGSIRENGSNGGRPEWTSGSVLLWELGRCTEGSIAGGGSDGDRDPSEVAPYAAGC